MNRALCKALLWPSHWLWRILASTLRGPFWTLRDPSRDLPPLWTLTEGPPRRMPWPDASLRCLNLVSLWGPTFSSNTTATTYFLASKNLQLLVYSGSLFISCHRGWVYVVRISSSFWVVIMSHAGFERPDAEGWRCYLRWRAQGPQKWRVSPL